MRIILTGWLYLFGQATAYLFLIVFLIIFCIAPISPDLPLLNGLPSSYTAVKSPDRGDDVWITIRATGSVYLAADEVSRSQLPAFLTRSLRAARYGEPTVRLRVDSGAPFGAVREVVRAAQEAGVTRVTVMCRVPPVLSF